MKIIIDGIGEFVYGDEGKWGNGKFEKGGKGGI